MSTAQEEDKPRERQKTGLNPSLYNPNPDEVEFLKKWTGIKDDAELKEHVLIVQKAAWDVKPYRCILIFGFLTFNLSRHPKYQYLLTLGKARPAAIFLDFGCCFGTDIRKAIDDGFPVENIITSDIEQEFWDLGHKLFKTEPGTFPVRFIQGDIFDASHVSPLEPLYSSPIIPRPDLGALTSLNPLRGHVAAIHASLFFHLFGRTQQIAAAKAIASLLSPEPGSVIFGMHSSRAVSGIRVNLRGTDVYDFGPEEWKALWDGEIFDKGTVEVEAELKNKVIRPGLTEKETGENPTVLVWSVMRK